jgi:hypothetical protein
MICQVHTFEAVFLGHPKFPCLLHDARRCVIIASEGNKSDFREAESPHHHAVPLPYVDDKIPQDNIHLSVLSTSNRPIAPLFSFGEIKV